MSKAQFIVIEGIDGAGTTTQCAMLADRLSEHGVCAHVTREPSNGPIGLLIRQILTGDLQVPGSEGAKPPSWPTMAALFAADRLHHLEAEIIPQLGDGKTVVCDRYDYSSVAYQTVSSGGGDEVSSWVRELNRHARRPDLSLVLSVDATIARERRDTRSGRPEIYELDEMQRKLATFYETIDELFPSDTIRYIDANRDAESVADLIWAEVRALRGESE